MTAPDTTRRRIGGIVPLAFMVAASMLATAGCGHKTAAGAPFSALVFIAAALWAFSGFVGGIIHG